MSWIKGMTPGGRLRTVILRTEKPRVGGQNHACPPSRPVTVIVTKTPRNKPDRVRQRELGLPSMPKRKTGRVTLPLIAREAAPTVLVTNDDIAAALEAEDVERYSSL